MRGTSFWLRRRDASEPIEYRADRPLHRCRIIAVKAVEVAAADEQVEIGVGDFNQVTPEATLPTSRSHAMRLAPGRALRIVVIGRIAVVNRGIVPPCPHYR